MKTMLVMFYSVIICTTVFAQDDFSINFITQDFDVVKRVGASHYKVVRVFDDSLKTPLSTGFIISSDGYILTVLHSIANIDRIKVEVLRFEDKKKVYYPAVIIDKNDTADVALLQIACKDLPFFNIYTGDIDYQGFEILTVGYPFGPYSATKGILSAIPFMPIYKKNLSDSILCWKDRLLLDITTNEGSSGSPVMLPKNGLVIGMIIGRYDPLSESDFIKIGGLSGLTSASRLGVAVQLKDIIKLMKKYKIQYKQ